MAKFHRSAKLDAKGKMIELEIPHPARVRIIKTSAHGVTVEVDDWTPPKHEGLIVPPNAGQLVRPA